MSLQTQITAQTTVAIQLRPAMIVLSERLPIHETKTAFDDQTQVKNLEAANKSCNPQFNVKQ